jgi:pantoate--beta-alanine ligase
MKIIRTVAEMHDFSDALRSAGKRIAVVPTMGFLHEGHLSLLRLARTRADAVIMTLFVNPTQFGPNEDFTRYPRDFERDSRLAASAGADVLFAPATEEIYPAGYSTFVEVERLTAVLEGASRPGHFRGVATVVAKLFLSTRPHVAVFGQKDAQQAAVIRRMAKDLNFGVEIAIGPIVREPDGLAMSSRNVYLSPAERAESVLLSRSLRHAEALARAGERNASAIIREMTGIIAASSSARIDYISVADAESLEELPLLQPGRTALVSLAVRFGATRLIDNILLTL